MYGSFVVNVLSQPLNAGAREIHNRRGVWSGPVLLWLGGFVDGGAEFVVGPTLPPTLAAAGQNFQQRKGKAPAKNSKVDFSKRSFVFLKLSLGRLLFGFVVHSRGRQRGFVVPESEVFLQVQ